MRPSTEQRIAGFDGLRALAVIAVFFSHKIHYWGGTAGVFGVTLFFALSGFLIVGILYQERLTVEAKRKTVDTAWKAFLVRRSFRIFPIYYLTLSVLALLAFSGISRFGWDPLGHVFHIFYLTNVYQHFVQKTWLGPYSHLWSLSAEEQFYLIAAPLLLYSPARMHLAICTTIVGVGLIGYFFSIGTFFFGNFVTIALGGVAVLVCKQFKCKLGGDALLFLAIGGFVATWVTLEIALKLAQEWLVTTLIVMAPVFAVLIVILVFTSQTGFIVRALEWKPLAHLGRISYGFYLYHNFIGVKIFGTVSIYHRVVTHLLEFCLIFIIAEISWHFVERPLISFAKARTDFKSAESHSEFRSIRQPSLMSQRTALIAASPTSGMLKNE